MNIAVTGATGNLGSVLVKKSIESSQTFISLPSELYRPIFHSLRVREFCQENRIKVLVHCASLTNVDYAEVNNKATHNSNVLLTRKLSEVAAKLEIKMVFISSTGVYGRNSFRSEGLSSEDDKTYPLNVYHATKLKAEAVAIKYCENVLILRVGWLFGSASLLGKDFVLARVQEMARLSSTEEYYSNTEQFGNPTSSEFVAEKISDLLLSDATGIINCVNDGAVSRYDFVRRIKEVCGFEFNLIPKPNNFFSRRALTPLNETASTSKLAVYSKPLHWDNYLVKYCNELKEGLGRES